MIAEGDDSTAFCVALHVLNAVPPVVRYLCGGVDFVRVHGGDGKDDDGGEGGAYDERRREDGSGAAAEQGGGPSAGGEGPGGGSGDRDEDSGGSSDEEGEGEDDAEVGFDDWSRRRERRYISSVVLERLATVDDAVEQLCVPRVLAHLVSVLHENGMEAGGVRL